MASKSFRAAAVLAMLLVLSALPAGAAPRPSQPSRLTSSQLQELLPSDAVVADSQGMTGKLSATQAVRQVVDHRNRKAWLGSIARMIEQRSGGRVASGGTTSSEPATGEDPGMEPAEPSSWAEAAPAGDLDGDGLGDVVAYVYDAAANTISLEARRGSDAEVLWALPGETEGGLAWPLDHDANGDGATELLTYDLLIDSEDYSDNCDDEDSPCDRGSYEATYRWIIGVRSGATGEPLWSRTFSGQLEESWSDEFGGEAVLNEYSGSYRFGGTNVNVFPMLADLQGDGSADMLLEAVDAMVTETYSDSWVGTPLADVGQFSGGSNLRAETRVDIANLADGTVAKTLTESGEGVVALLSPVGAAGGDDLVWERSLSPDSDYECTYVWSYQSYEHCTGTASSESLEVVLIDGRTFEPRWTKASDGWGMVWPLGGDLDADGRDDLALLRQTEDWSLSSDYLSAATGAALWSVADGDPFAVAAYDREAGDDVLVLRFADNSDDPLAQDYTETMTMERRNGKTGAVLASTQRTTSMDGDGDFNYGMLYVAGTHDLDGDGVGDLTHGAVNYSGQCVEDEEDEYCEITSVSSDAVAESGRSGAQLMRESSQDRATVLSGTGDLDGDGRAELMRESEVWSFGPDGEDVSFTIDMVRVADGSTLWSDQPGDDWLYYDIAGNLDGGAGDDLLRNSMGGYGVVVADAESEGGSSEPDPGEPADFYAGVSAVDGATGAISWSVPAR